jgi:hypothetical protein
MNQEYHRTRRCSIVRYLPFIEICPPSVVPDEDWGCTTYHPQNANMGVCIHPDWLTINLNKEQVRKVRKTMKEREAKREAREAGIEVRTTRIFGKPRAMSRRMPPVRYSSRYR